MSSETDTDGPARDGPALDDEAVELVHRRGRVRFSDHLVDLVGRVEAHAARVRSADADARRRCAAAARVETARRSLRLDASPLTDETAEAVERGEAALQPLVAPAPDAAVDGWVAALGLEGVAPQEVAAVEYANCLAAVDAEPALAERLFAEPHATLVALHERLTDGLVDPVRADRGRTVDQAVHDGAQGQLLFALPDPEVARARLAALCDWLGGASASVPTPVLAGIVHESLLAWQPFEGAGGRLARGAARLVTRARGLDPDGALVWDRRAGADPVGYHRQVAASIRRRGDLGMWLEWWLEGAAVTAAAVADRALGAIPSVPSRLAEWAAGSPPEAVTAFEYAAAVGCAPDDAVRELRLGERAGTVRAEPGTRGLRFRLGPAPELG